MTHTSQDELKTIEQKIEDARNILTIVEEDSHRFQRLTESERYSWSEVKKAKEEIESQVNNYQKQLKDLVEEIAKLQLEQESLNADNASSRKSFVEVNANIDSINAKHADTHETLKKIEQGQKVKDIELSKRENAVSASEKALADKHQKIKEFKETI